MEYTINELMQKLYPKIFETFDIFKNYFGEEFTDLHFLTTHIEAYCIASYQKKDDKYDISDENLEALSTVFNNQKATIYIWWPSVRVANENDKSIIIKDLYAALEITKEGTIPYESSGFKLTKATFSMAQFISGYVHSHVPGWYIYNEDIPIFKNPCLGTGPIKNTIMELKNNWSEIEWLLFCQELAMYVTVESLKGGPYKRLEEVGILKPSSKYSGYTDAPYSISHMYFRGINKEELSELLKNFTLYYIEHNHLSFTFENKKFSIGNSYYDYIIDISNAFIAWFNANGNADIKDRMYENQILNKVYVANGHIYDSKNNSNIDVRAFNGRRLFSFKGRDIRLHIESDAHEDSSESVTLLNHNLAMFIITNILRIINYRYNNGYTERNREERTSSTYKTVFYI